MQQPQRNPVFWLLSWIFRLIVAVRRAAYRTGLLRQTALPCPVIVIGNIVAGGAGKTPLCLACIAQLQRWGYRVGVVARGYGRNAALRTTISAVHAHSPWQSVGEEALLLHQHGKVPVMVGANRVTAAQALLQAHPDIQIILCDDGLQHYALARNIEIVLLDERGSDGGRMLPYGWLREPWPRQPLTTPRHAAPLSLSLGPLARHLQWSPTVARPAAVAAFAAIGQPERFFAALRGAGLQLTHTLALPDHDGYSRSGVFARWLQLLPPAVPLCCTEKDAVKLQQDWPELPARLIVPHLILAVPDALWHNLHAALAPLVQPRLPQH